MYGSDRGRWQSQDVRDSLGSGCC